MVDGSGSAIPERAPASVPRVGAVVVHFRGREPLRRCLEASSSIERVAEIVVVDNEGVGAELRRAHPDTMVRIIQMRRNAGYGAAANVGLHLSRGDAVLVLNQDAVPSSAVLESMLRAGQEAGAWVVGPRLVGADGYEAPPKIRFPAPLRWQPPQGRGKGWQYVPWVSGAAMLFMPGHTDLRFDERLFMYAEDEELCWRVWAAGGRVAWAEAAEVVHAGGTATATRWGRRSITLRTVANRARFVRWHRGWGGAAAYLAAAAREIPGRLAGRGRGA